MPTVRSSKSSKNEENKHENKPVADTIKRDKDERKRERHSQRLLKEPKKKKESRKKAK